MISRRPRRPVLPQERASCQKMSWSPAQEFGPWWRAGLALVILVAVGLQVADSFFRWDTVRRTSSVVLTDVAPGTQRIPVGSFEEHTLLPGTSMDARWWVLHTRQMLEEGGWRVRFTTLDNAPEGREVHWSSLLLWLLGGGAVVASWFMGKPPAELIAWVALGVGPVMLVGWSALVLFFLRRRVGWSGGLFFLSAALSSYSVTRTFQAGEADHHGIVLGFAVLGVLGLVIGGGGRVLSAGTGGAEEASFWRPQRREVACLWFRWAGFFSAAALWVSAATAIPVLAGTAVGVLLSARFLRGQSAGKIRYDGSLWWVWAQAGAISALGFYLLEYFPSAMGWRLEVNHPLFAVAWLGGGFALARLSGWLAGVGKWNRGDGLRWVLAVAAGAAPLVAVLASNREVFWVGDSFLLALHERFIFEFQSLPRLLALAGWNLAILTYFPLTIFSALGFIWVWKVRALTPGAGSALLLVLPSVLLMQALAIYQVRWASTSFALWAVLFFLLWLAAVGPGVPTDKRKCGAWAGLAAVLAALLVTQLPQVLVAAEESRTALVPPIAQKHGHSIILRDLAHRLLHASPERVPVVLSGPNSSTDLSYHGQIRTLGTLYWENKPGLKRAAELFALESEKEVKAALEEAGVTHILVPGWDDFTEAYLSLWADYQGVPEPQSYLREVVAGRAEPPWLRPFAYPLPTESGLDAHSVKIFAFLPTQNAFENAWFRGIFHAESQEWTAARKWMEEAARLRPQDPRPGQLLQTWPRETETSVHEEGTVTN